MFHIRLTTQSSVKRITYMLNFVPIILRAGARCAPSRALGDTRDYHAKKIGRSVDRARGRLFASSVTAAMIRPQVVSPSASGERELVSSIGAFLERFLAVALEHQLCRPPYVDLGYHATKSCTAVVDKRFRTGPGCVSMWWRDGADIDPQDVVRRIAAECTFVDERGGVGIRLRPATAIVRQYGEQFRALGCHRRPRSAKPPPLL